MRILWSSLRYLSPGILTAIKRVTSPSLRLRLRELLGGSHRNIPDRIIQVADGRSFHIGPDIIYWPLYVGLDFEPEATSVLSDLVRPGDTVLDVGANYGWYATLFGQRVGETGQVHAFEPVPATFARLQEHIRINGLEGHVTAHRSAVGSRQDELDIHVFDRLSHARSSFSPLDQDGAFSTFRTPVIDLDTFLAERGIDEVALLKCDVEGAEMMVLEGSRRLLDSPTAPIILIELNAETARAFDYDPVDLWKLLSARGYDHFYAIDGVQSIRRVDDGSDIAGLDLLLAGKGDRIKSRMG